MKPEPFVLFYRSAQSNRELAIVRICRYCCPLILLLSCIDFGWELTNPRSRLVADYGDVVFLLLASSVVGSLILFFSVVIKRNSRRAKLAMIIPLVLSIIVLTLSLFLPRLQ